LYPYYPALVVQKLGFRRVTLVAPRVYLAPLYEKVARKGEQRGEKRRRRQA
jgi:hypothetical protein